MLEIELKELFLASCISLSFFSSAILLPTVIATSAIAKAGPANDATLPMLFAILTAPHGLNLAPKKWPTLRTIGFVLNDVDSISVNIFYGFSRCAFSLTFHEIPAKAIEAAVLPSLALAGSGKLLVRSIITPLSVTGFLL